MVAAAVAAGEKRLSPPRCAVAHAWVAAPVYRALSREAERLRLHPDRLTAEIITKLAEKGLLGAVLKIDD
jgi:hypothetical protein